MRMTRGLKNMTCEILLKDYLQISEGHPGKKGVRFLP
jgi:hypothetical protein